MIDAIGDKPFPDMRDDDLRPDLDDDVSFDSQAAMPNLNESLTEAMLE